MKKEEYLSVNSEITKNGLRIYVDGKEYNISYPEHVWNSYSDHNKEVLKDNIAFMQTCHLGASTKKTGIKYNSNMPCFETYAFKGTMLDIPSTAVIDHEKTTDYIRGFFNSDFQFKKYTATLPKPKKLRPIKPRAVILFTAGKESLLNLALCLELGIEPIPVYMDEEPDLPESKHKSKIIKQIEEQYKIPVHRIFNESGKLRYCDLGEEENNWGAGTQFLTYLLEILPFAEHYGAEYVLFGNEYSCDDFTYCKENFKSNFCFDQCTAWTKQLNVIAKTMSGEQLEVGSLVAPLYELGLIKVLHERYPELGKLQMSCFSDTEEGKDRIWCGNCSKCARMYVFFKALGIDTKILGYENNMFNKISMNNFSVFESKGLYSYDVSGLGSEQSLAFFMASQRGEEGFLIDKFKKSKSYKEIRDKYYSVYQKYFSQYDSVAVPKNLRESVKKIFDDTLSGVFEPLDFRKTKQ